MKWGVRKRTVCFSSPQKSTHLIIARHWNTSAKAPNVSVLQERYVVLGLHVFHTSCTVCGESFMWFWSAGQPHVSLYFWVRLWWSPKFPLLSNLLFSSEMLLFTYRQLKQKIDSLSHFGVVFLFFSWCFTVILSTPFPEPFPAQAQYLASASASLKVRGSR